MDVCEAKTLIPLKPLLFIGQQQDTIEQYIQKVGIPDGLMVYTSIQDMEGLDSPSDKGAGIQYAQYYVTHYPKAALQLAVYMKDALKDVMDGKYDQNIRHLAQWIKQSKRTVYLRIGYEFDLPANHYDPQLYQQAFRYIVDHLRSNKVSNVFYVWHSAAMMNGTGDFDPWYPGDNYVDWFAISFFNPSQAKMAENFLELAQKHHKPFMIAESTPAGLYTLRGRKDWFNKYFNFIKNHPVKIICYIDSNWDRYPLFKNDSWGDARVEKDMDLKAMWLNFTESLKK